ncbi:putative kinesin [Leishmania major strain Friedlin]|uniref:Putative kinesin n=1 Tax=Leishmania major TaxID=5664 RepID=Q4QI22_LEIMA|nr:putative kinesin [Leishmania major strain Friedlin]CAG9569582.1 kinesin_-__putative [Leishmania major strain Friedlin]CAJ02331.1 putative kinesin [Leishmania major strain Friedlin]|eukprot:XP_001681176.1 putative kinesin [Leishmania major strain Friedlin]
MTERIIVAVRVRPFLPHENEARCLEVSENQVAVGAGHPFVFDRVFDETASSDDIYVALGQPLADSFLTGFHASTIAYGQTGSGKTFTMAALLHDTVQEVFCRLTEDSEATLSTGRSSSALTSLSATLRTSPAFTMSLSVLEVYNESIGDLLAELVSQPPRQHTATVLNGTVPQAVDAPRRPSAQGCGPLQNRRLLQRRAYGPTSPFPRNSLALREDPHGGVYVVGLTEAQVRSEAEMLALIDSAIENRKTASTLKNSKSSRSHCVITLTLQRRGLCSRCCFVDLAGFERLKSRGEAVPSGGPGDPASLVGASLPSCRTLSERMRECININSGLLALGNVIVALCERKPYVPYRSSKLTRLLQPMLSGNARTAIVACISQLASSMEETLNTLKYADRAKRIHIHPHLAVAEVTTSADARQTILLLQEQLEDAQRRLAIAVPAGAGTRKPARSPSASLVQEVKHLRELLRQERQLTKRLENDVLNAECATMVEVEKRKALEVRVAQLKAASAADPKAEGAGCTEVSADGDTGKSASSLLNPRSCLAVDMTRLQQLEEEREALAALPAQKARDTVQLEAALVENGNCVADNLAATLTVNADDDSNVVTLAEDIVAQKDRVAQLQMENGDVSAQLVQREKLRRTLSNHAHPRGELRKTEVKLGKSEVALKQRKQVKEKLRTASGDRLRRAREKSVDYRGRVKGSTQHVRVRQVDLESTRQLHEKLVVLQEEVFRQRLCARTTRKASWKLNDAHQQEVEQFQKQLQLMAIQTTSPNQRTNRRGAGIVKERGQLAGQQVQAQRPQQEVPSPGRLCHLPPEKTLSSMPFSPSAKASPPSPALGKTSPHIIKVHKNSHASSSWPGFHPHGLHSSIDGALQSSRDATQTTINCELQDLERIQKELVELLVYRRALLTAPAADASKWHRAKDGFARRLSQVQAALQSTEPGQREHTALLKEKNNVKEQLRQLQAFRHMFADPAQQLAELDNRIEDLNRAHRLHTQRFCQLQRAVPKPRGNGGVVAAREKHQPSVRHMRTASARYAAAGTLALHTAVESSQGSNGNMREYVTGSKQ